MSKRPRSTRTTTATTSPVVPPSDVTATTATETAVTTSTPDASTTPITLPEFDVNVTTFARVSTPDHAHTFTVPVPPIVARIVRSVRAMMSTTADAADTADTFRARVAAFRLAWDRDATVPTDWNKIPGNRSAFGAGIMDTQNAVVAALIVSGVTVPDAAVMAAWRALVPVTRCAFESKRYGLSSLGDLANGRQRPTSIPGVPDGTYGPAVFRLHMMARGGRVHPFIVTIPVDTPTA